MKRIALDISEEEHRRVLDAIDGIYIRNLSQLVRVAIDKFLTEMEQEDFDRMVQETDLCPELPEEQNRGWPTTLRATQHLLYHLYAHTHPHGRGSMDEVMLYSIFVPQVFPDYKAHYSKLEKAGFIRTYEVEGGVFYELVGYDEDAPSQTNSAPRYRYRYREE